MNPTPAPVTKLEIARDVMLAYSEHSTIGMLAREVVRLHGIVAAQMLDSLAHPSALPPAEQGQREKVKWKATAHFDDGPMEYEGTFSASAARPSLAPSSEVAPAMPEPPSHWSYAEREAWKAGWYAGNQAARKK